MAERYTQEDGTVIEKQSDGSWKRVSSTEGEKAYTGGTGKKEITLSSDKTIQEGQRSGLQTAEAIYGQDLFSLGEDVQDIKGRRETALDSKDPASTRMRESKNAQIRAARASGATKGQEAQIERQAAFDIGQSEFRNQQEALDSYQKLLGNMVGGTASLMTTTGQLEKSGEEVAPPESDGGMCFITTAVCERLGLEDDNEILNTFRKFRDEHLFGKSGVSEYYEKAPSIVQIIKDSGAEEIYDELFLGFLMPAYLNIKKGNNEIAYKIYKEMCTNIGNACGIKFDGGKDA